MNIVDIAKKLVERTDRFKAVNRSGIDSIDFEDKRDNRTFRVEYFGYQSQLVVEVLGIFNVNIYIRYIFYPVSDYKTSVKYITRSVDETIDVNHYRLIGVIKRSYPHNFSIISHIDRWYRYVDSGTEVLEIIILIFNQKTAEFYVKCNINVDNFSSPFSRLDKDIYLVREDYTDKTITFDQWVNELKHRIVSEFNSYVTGYTKKCRS